MSEHDDKDREPDADIGRVLRAAGRRTEPPDAVKQEVRAAVEAEWRKFVAQRSRTRRQRWQLVAVAAGLAAVALALWLSRSWFVATPVQRIASIDKVLGEAQVAGEWGRRRAAVQGQTMFSGEELRTGPGAIVAIELEGGVVVRLDADTRVRIADRSLVLKTGAVYVDSQQKESAWAIQTAVGVVRHLGTQYEVRVLDHAMRVTVREGRVATTLRKGNTEIAQAGERLLLSADGEVRRETVPVYGNQWDWIARAAPTFVIEGRSLMEFLTWAGRELGLQIVFDTPANEVEARRVILHGDIAGLTPQAALNAVLSTTRFRSSEQGEQLLIDAG